MNQTKKNLLIDVGIAAAFLLAVAQEATGQTIHEWLGIALGGALMVHLLLHWKWVVATTQRFFGKLARQARINYLLNLGLLVSFTTVIGSGLMISESVMATLGLASPGGGLWEGLHHLSTNLVIGLVALHIALHWHWIMNAVKRYIVQPMMQSNKSKKAIPNAITVPAKDR
ncbi:MAG: DUF4405 domain-containing protein [Chloroflexi bacterium]|nr:MAG: DUF4405 domain-containing protein [Chloroflexota bacterium]MBL1194565.1 DUF4405 domain-containing protein [Chloroflexota bacterium]NOH11854.1 cytochrome b/b6 domain-containing protein [Chloroflexota bacterium]